MAVHRAACLLWRVPEVLRLAPCQSTSSSLAIFQVYGTLHVHYFSLVLRSCSAPVHHATVLALTCTVSPPSAVIFLDSIVPAGITRLPH